MTALAAAWMHDLNPWVVRFTDSFGIRWYGVTYVLGFVLGIIVMRMLAKRGLILIPRDRILDAAMWLVAGVLVGGRLGYVFFYKPDLLFSFSGDLPFWGVLAINQGGMASHGGIVGVILASWRVSLGWKDDETGERIGRCPPLHVMDVLALVSCFGLGLGRVANFINGELLGRVVAPPGEPGPWWGVKYPQEAIERWDELPAEQRESLAELVSLDANTIDQSIDARALFEQAMYGIIEKIQDGDQAWIARLEPLLSTRHPSQIYQVIGDGVVVGLACALAWMKPRVPGVVGAWFLIVYGLQRVVTEGLWRLPDVGVAGFLGLSRGQWLSLAMSAVGVAILVWRVRAGGDKLGGWLHGKNGLRQPAADA